MIQALGLAFGFEPPYYGNGPKPFYLVGRPGFWGGFGGWLDLFTPIVWEYATYFERPRGDVGSYMDWYLAGLDLTSAAQQQERLELVP